MSKPPDTYNEKPGEDGRQSTPALKRASAAFSELSPQLAISAVEEAWELRCDGSFFAYPSYVNRVYGLRDEDERDFVVKFYRPGRWSASAILEEHAFLQELAAAEVPVVCPLPDNEGNTLASLVLESEHSEVEIPYALFPKRPGRSFDADSLDDMRRLGALAGRIHAVGALRPARQRLRIQTGLAGSLAAELLEPGLIPAELFDQAADSLRAAAVFIDGELAAKAGSSIRLHGDFHRGNILDCGGSSLSAVDFDDMSQGPAVLDLWMLLPDRPEKAAAERDALLEGYEMFMSFDYRSFALAPALQLLRIMHFWVWQSRQRHDSGFLGHFPGWGSRGFWQQETEYLACKLADLQQGR
ncbi:MAG: serine/threonine protein kinase [Spirochaetes bacterium]|nr:serine/threonine protein kinase [Spirochaetota bacterium]